MNVDPGKAGPVGVVGLGNIGLPVALRLLAEGFTVYGCARRPPSPRFSEAGGRPCRDPAEVAANSDIVLTLLPSPEALADAAAGPRGFTASARRHGLWVEMSSVHERDKRAAARQLDGLHWTMLDCPISGAPQQVRNGGAVLFGSGEREAFDRAEPVLRAISPRVHYVGAFGHGMRAKCTAYILVAGHTLVAAEALAFARKAGLSPADILAMLSGTINSSAVFEQRAPQILNPVGASGNSHGFGQSLAPAHRLAAELGAPTPVLTEVLRRIARLPGDAADEPVAALYHQLTDPAEERA